MNKRIAELRGDKKCIYMKDWPDGGCMGDCDGCANPHSKPYDTDIACAMELWEEMAQHGVIEILEDLAGEDAGADTVRVRYLPWKVMDSPLDKTGLISIWDTKKPKAIAGAWLKWKEAS